MNNIRTKKSLKPRIHSDGFRPSKALGQHFLKSKTVVLRMVSVANINKKDTVLEIGPGKGLLTETLLESAGTVVAIEKDEQLGKLLKKRFGENKKFRLIVGDVLTQYASDESSYKLVANIPYYITGAILEHFLTLKKQPKSMTLLVQKEVADRIVARDKKESILSLSVKAYGRPEYIRTVPAWLFSPPPKVFSAILHISDISRKSFGDISENDFFSLIKCGFGQKRKQLKNNLSVKYDKSLLTECLKKLDLKEDVRAEDVPLQKWFSLAKALKK